MNTHPEVDHSANEGAAPAAAIRERDRAPDRSSAKEQSTPGLATQQPDRVSVDPLRATDRYRLVSPLPLRL